MDTILIELDPIIAIAMEVIAGKWGNGDERKKLLEAAGYNYIRIQECVNDLLDVAYKYRG